MSECKHMKVPVKNMPDKIIEECNLHNKIKNGFACVKIRKGMCGLPHAGKIANDRLVKHLEQHSHHQAKHTHGLFHHNNNSAQFCLAVDNFGVKCTNKKGAEHLAKCLGKLCEATIDWTGTKFLGLTLNWNHSKHTVELSMPGCIIKALLRFVHPSPTAPQHSPSPFSKPTHGKRDHNSLHP